MKFKCITCGYEGAPTWRDQKYHCPCCDTEIPESMLTADTPSDEKAVDSTNGSAVDAFCPVCDNASGNTMHNGKCRCALCGTEFELDDDFDDDFDDDEYEKAAVDKLLRDTQMQLEYYARLAKKSKRIQPRIGFLVTAAILGIAAIAELFIAIFSDPNMFFPFAMLAVLAGMFAVLTFSPKEDKCIFGKESGLPKNVFVIICSVVAFIIAVVSEFFY